MHNLNHKISEARQGELLIFTASIFGSLLPVLVNPHSTSLAPVWIVAFSTVLALLPISFLMFKQKRWSDLRNKTGLKYSILAGLFIGVIYTGLVHWGSYYTPPQNASILLCLETFSTILFLHRRKNESLSRREIAGAALLFSGVALVFFDRTSQIRSGDIILLIATFVPPIGNTFMKVARKHVSSITIMWTRSVFSSLILTCIGLTISNFPSSSEIMAASTVLLINGILIIGISKLFRIEGIYRIPIAKASALASITPLLAFLFAWLILAKYPNSYQLLALPPTILGVLLILRKRIF